MTREAAYRRTLYRAGGVTARVGQRSTSADLWLRALGRRTASFMTAWNPMSRRHTQGWNARRQEALRALLRHYPRLEGESGFRQWFEHNLLVAADARRLLRVARLFRQAAILTLHQGQPARLHYNPRLAYR